MNFITYEDKKTLQEHPEIDEVNKVTADNMNQIKNGINIIYNKTNGDSTMTEQGTSITLNNTLNAPLKNIEFYGDTEQDGTPTPDNPIEINSVTGGQVVSICGKNLFDKNNFNEIRGTINSTSSIFTYASDSLNYCFYIPCKPNTTYTIQKRNDGNTNRFSFGSCSTTISTSQSVATNLTTAITDNDASSLTITTGVNDIYLIAQYYRSAETTLTKQQILDSIQIEKGSTAADYEEYKGQSYEINLGKNLLNLEDGTYSNNDITAVVSNGKITLNGTNTSNAFITIPVNLNVIGKYTLSASNNETIANVSPRFDSGSLAFNCSNTNASATDTFNSLTTLTNFVIRVQSGSDLTNFVIYPQLEKGSTATSFSPYFTPIELNKIGNYEDRIYKDNGKWYLEKNIKKLDMSTITSWCKNTNGKFYRINFVNVYGIRVGEILSNIFTYSSSSWEGDGKFGITSAGVLWMETGDTTLNNVDNVPNWLSNKNAYLLGILTTPTTTEITDTTLINQLNNIYNANTYKEKTEISVDGNLPSILDITAYTNTLNGIHESLNDRLTTLSNS